METIWIILGLASLVLLAVHWGGRNAVWGGLTGGVIIGLVVTFFSGFDWYLVMKWAISGTLVGFGAEMLGGLPDLIRAKK